MQMVCRAIKEAPVVKNAPPVHAHDLKSKLSVDVIEDFFPVLDWRHTLLVSPSLSQLASEDSFLFLNEAQTS
ncbi:hypothetical protein CEXT_40611 [Caerostris extrusa]|uniref:Uncharacterized protein n=1 Tax=Caerostris extrusa TaxID=172846 RepID=A0AAV4S2D4_CAEEX|nr:hypothetical protein CEXT_40611 [Caerostris extrusa]